MNRQVFFSLVGIGIAFRVLMILVPELINGGEVDVYLADEGIVGMMGKHIMEGRELPVFFYGQHYLGALEAYAAALVFSVAGPGFLPLRVVTLLFSLGLGAAVYSFVYRYYSVAAARWATALVAVAPMYFLQWNLKARGGFVEHLLLVFLVMLAFWRFYLAHRRDRVTALTLGLLTGIALWVNQLVLAYMVVMGALLATRYGDRRGWAEVVVGTVLGASLLLGYNVVHPGATLKTLGRKAVVVNRVPIDQRDESWLARGLAKRVEAISHGLGNLGLVFGVPPSEKLDRVGVSSAVRGGGPLAGARSVSWPIPALVFGAGLLAGLPRRGRGGWAPVGSDQLLGLFALATFAVGYVSSRYMLAAYPLAAVMVGVLLSRSRGPALRWMQVGVVGVLLFNMAGWTDALMLRGRVDAERGKPLLEFLAANDLAACYSAGPLYHLVFESNEGVVLAPLQNDRYPRYNEIVEASERICYVFRPDQQKKRQHKALIALLAERGVEYRRADVGSYQVLYGFEPRAALDGEAIERLRHQETATLTLGAFGARD